LKPLFIRNFYGKDIMIERCLCGNDVRASYDEAIENGKQYFTCHDCGMVSEPGYSMENAVQKWNKLIQQRKQEVKELHP